MELIHVFVKLPLAHFFCTIPFFVVIDTQGSSRGSVCVYGINVNAPIIPSKSSSLGFPAFLFLLLLL
jgi:hypothetical protein